MKIRIKGDSIRYRLTKTDVRNLYEKGEVKETTNFGHTQFMYALIMKKNMTKDLEADFENGQITIAINFLKAEELYKTDLVTVETTQENRVPEGLVLLVEKDFKCLDETHENQDDNFEHPNMVC